MCGPSVQHYRALGSDQGEHSVYARVRRQSRRSVLTLSPTLRGEGFNEPQGPKSLDALTRIRSNGKHLLGLINTVLDIAKIESGQFNLNLGEYALETVVETVRAATEALAETKKLALTTDVTKWLPIGIGDEQRLTQVLLNLVGNAIKFTDKGGVQISAKAVNSHFAITVTDTGPGIAEAHLRAVPPGR